MAIPFFAFRIMVGIGVIMLGLVVASWWLRFKGRLFETRWFLRACQFVAPLGFVAVLAGWTTTEVGRQPWTVYGLLRTADSVSPSLTGMDVRISLADISWRISSCFPAGLLIMGRLVRRGPVDSAMDESPDRKRQARPSGPPASNRFREARAMNSMVLDTVPIWTFILGVGVFFYVLLDGFDLGVGMLFGLAPDTPSRNLVMNSIAPIWDGNETWLVLGGLALLAAFPLAFAIIIPAVYFPILVMLLALIFRGVAFEFRYRDAEHKTFWDYGFVYGSAIATFAQGMVLGAFIQGSRSRAACSPADRSTSSRHSRL